MSKKYKGYFLERTPLGWMMKVFEHEQPYSGTTYFKTEKAARDMVDRVLELSNPFWKTKY